MEFAPDWQKGQKEMPLIDIAGIKKVPISMLVGTSDTMCPYATAQQTA